MTDRRLLLLLVCVAVCHAAPRGHQDRVHPPGLRSSGTAKVTRDWESMAHEDIKRALESQPIVKEARNVILFLGDGMGLSTITAARQLMAQTHDDVELPEADLEWDRFYHVGLSKTYNIDRSVPDSAATGTAFLCGQKAMYSTIGVTQDADYDNCTSVTGNKVDSILKKAIKNKGRWGGVVTQTRVTHATPAAAYAHVANRNWESEVPSDVPGADLCTDTAYQLVMDDSNQDIRVVLGGGRRVFLDANMTDPVTGENGYRTDGYDLMQEWENKRAESLTEDKYRLVLDKDEFDAADPAKLEYLMGLFAFSEMDYEYHRNNDEAPSLSEMTTKAIQMLSKNDKGYFLLVEGGRIDQAHHDNSAFLALHETLEFNEAVRNALAETDEEDTLIVVTADHSHAFTLGGYPSIDNDLFGLDNSWWDTQDKKPYTGLGYANGPSFVVHRTEDGNIDNVIPRKNLTGIDTTADDFVQDAGVPLDYETHGGEDVGIYAHGPMSHLFHGVHEQTYIAHAMMYASCIADANAPHCNPDISGGDRSAVVTARGLLLGAPLLAIILGQLV